MLGGMQFGVLVAVLFCEILVEVLFCELDGRALGGMQFCEVEP